MNISLPGPLEAWVDDRVSSGMYQSASEVVREALRLLRDQEELKQIQVRDIRRQLQAGVEQLDTGLSKPFSQSVVEEVKAKARKHRSKK